MDASIETLTEITVTKKPKGTMHKNLFVAVVLYGHET
jgi:hypothetical protein